MPDRLAGIIAASLTPLDAAHAIDHAALAAHLQRLLGDGCDAVALFGTTGEAPSFGVDERRAALDAVVASGVPAGRLLVGTGCCALPEAATLTRHALTAGAGGVLVLPPFYFKDVSDDGLFAFFDGLVQTVGDERLRLYLYHFPRMSGVPISAALIERLRARYPRAVVGLKDSSGDAAHLHRLLDAFPEMAIFAGTERLLLDGLRAGAAGCISATANVTAALAAEVRAGWHAGEPPHAEALQDRLTRIRQTIERFPMIPALKHLFGYAAIRPPLRPLDAAQAAALDAALARLDFRAAPTRP